ncbi:hypothetical protein PGIGA_G00032990 [Pangasianodon gigas]|uniref:Uncharacterized protein n=1 Tax=Pangasianodon gigas TaxID=30993 RepID=A0ACC5WZ84_PANGG|nr:hypothetical protein [Pangasianodon gigas]
MSCLEKQHVSQKASMQHPSNLDSFMDETDREVMNLTDRAFKSLCIGDEAIYNDSELLPSPVDCHKPLAEEIPKKPRENSALDVKKHGAHWPNGMYNTPWQMNKNTSKMSSLFAAFAAKKNNDTKMTNGDSWDKSALLSIQTELSEFSSDYQNHLMDEHIYKVKSHRKPSEKGTVNKSIQDTYNSSGKSSKNQHSKSTKLRKLNSKNFFLHSEFSPFQSWGDLNRFGLENMEMFPCNSPAGLYDSPLYRELNNSDRLHVPQPNKRETSQSTSPLEPQHKSKPDLSQCTAQTLETVPPVSEKHSELKLLKLPDLQIETLQPQVLQTSSGSFQRCQSEGDLYAPWRKSRSRAKGVVQPLISSPGCERLNTGEEGAIQNKKEVRTVEEATCLNLTPFSISQLLTPVIPSRQGTGNSEILQSVHSPVALDFPALHETEIRPSPEIKREGYKSKASSLLFNLKDNRKRVKATYSPPKFKGLDAADQNKLSPLIEQDVTKNVLESPEITDSKTISTVQKTINYPMSPATADIQSSQSSGHINSTLPDDFLGLSLLQAGNRGSPIKPLKSKKNPLAKATYPSLNLYRKSSPVELNTKTMPMDVPGSHSIVNKSAEQKLGKEHLPEKDSKELQRKCHLTKPEINYANQEYTHLNVGTADKVLTGKTDAVALKEKYFPTVLKKHNPQQDAPTISGSRNQEKLNTGGICKEEERPFRYNECHRKETKPKHLFSARQNNYIKNQRYVNLDENYHEGDECEYWQENVISAGRDELRKRELNVDVHKDKGKVQENMDVPLIKESVTNDASTKNNYSVPLKNDLGICTEKEVSKNAFSMKGNTSAKIALFTLKEQSSNTVPGSKKKNIVKDKYELATMALEKRNAERERRQKQSDRQNGQDLPMKRDHNQENMIALGQKETSGSVLPDRRGQKAISDFTPTSQNVRSMSDVDTNHGECHVPEVKLADPYKQEGASKHSPSRLIYSDRDRSDRHGQQGDTSNIKSMANATELKETVSMPKNISLDQESSVVQDYIDNKLVSVGGDESSIQKKKSSYKPEAPPRRERANSQSEDRAINERKRKEDVGNVERSVNNDECLSTESQKSTLPKDKGPVIGHVPSLMENFNREQVVPSLNVQENLHQGDGLMVHPRNDLLKQKAISPKNIMGLTEVEGILTEHNHTEREAYSDSKEVPDNDSKLAMGNEENLGGEIADKQAIRTGNKDVTRNEEDKKDVTKPENESASDVLRKTGNQTKSKCHGESSVKEYLTDHFGNSDEPDDESEKTPTLNLLNADHAPMDRITLYDILNQAEPSSLVDVKPLEQGNLPSKLSEDSSFSHKTEDLPSLNNGEERKCENLYTMDSCSNSNPESKLHNSDMAVPPPQDVEKGGWVRCLIDSAHNLTPTCQSNASSPTLGKPALFKVKDNTFSTSPVTKTVRPILHKTVAGVTQPWSPRESLSGSERGEEDPDIFKDIVDMQCLPSTPVRITQPNQSSIQVVPHPSSQSTTVRDRKGLMDTSTVPEEEEWQLAKTLVSEGRENCEMSAEDTVEELAFNTAPTDSIEGSKAPSDRSESACSGIENQLQGKPPVVPPKTEKALRRAMKLTTKRIQKAEAKSKSERGRSSEKGSCQKRERRHQSSDKVLSDRSHQREHSIDRGSSNQSTGESSSERSLAKSHTSERHATHHNKPNSHRKEKDTGRKLQHGCQSSLINMDGDAKSCVAEKQKENQSQHKNQFDTQNINVDCERLGRTSEKYLPHKLYRRAHSLDRFSSSKHEHRLLSAEDPVSKTNTEALKKLSTAQTAPLRRNSIENTYGSPTNNIVPQSFPMTQRKLLQDLDSGQYFVVDMPVQVKTKTFFDPETGSYVQLPVQSLEGSVPRAQSVEVVNAPPLMLYHGFVPVPVSSLP